MTVGADGRFSKVRKLAGFDPVKISSPIDVLWFRISRREGDPKEALAARVGSGMFMVFIDRFDYWQVACTIVKGGYKEVRVTGLDRLRRSLARVAPEWADRFETSLMSSSGTARTEWIAAPTTTSALSSKASSPSGERMPSA